MLRDVTLALLVSAGAAGRRPGVAHQAQRSPQKELHPQQ